MLCSEVYKVCISVEKGIDRKYTKMKLLTKIKGSGLLVTGSGIEICWH